MKATLQPGVLPKLLGELYVARKSGELSLSHHDESLTLNLSEGLIDGLRSAGRLEQLLRAFSWPEGYCSFVEQPVQPGKSEAAASDVSTPELIREGIWRLEDAAVIRSALGELDQVLMPVAAPPGSAPLGPLDGLVLSQVDGVRSLGEVIEGVSLPADETRRSLLGLLCMGLVKPRSEAGAGSREAAAPRTSEAGEQTTQPSGPAAYEDPELSAGIVPQDLVENALFADDALRKATHLMATGDHWASIRLLEMAIPRIQAKKLRREAKVQLARAYSKNPKWVRRAEEMLHEVLRDDPSCIDAYVALGLIYKDSGLRVRALNMFRKVAELKPGHMLATAEIRSLDARAPQWKPFSTR